VRPMRVAVGVAVAEAVLLVGLAFLQFLGARHLPRSLDPLTDPLVSTLRWIEVVVWLAAPPLIGVLVGRTDGRKLSAAGLAFAAVASAVVASPLLQQLAASGWTLLESGQTPPDLFFFAPPGGWSQGYAIPLLIVIGVLVAGGVAAIEAAVAAGLAQRLGTHRSGPISKTTD
jgi:hypothetical protein